MTRDYRYGLFDFRKGTIWFQTTEGWCYYRTEEFEDRDLLYSLESDVKDVGNNELKLGPLELVEWSND